MPRFRYVAMDPKGVETEGVLDAETQAQAVSIIRSKGFFPTRVVEFGSGAPARKAVVRTSEKTEKVATRTFFQRFRFLRRGVQRAQLMVFTRQLATLVDAGLPLLRGLRILLKQEKNPALREAIAGLGEAVEGGSTFSEALAQYPAIFDKLFVNMVRAGEAGGVLEVVLLRLAEFMEKAERIRNKIRSAMYYPVVVLVAALVILVFLLVKIIPQFQQIFQDMFETKSLPVLTQFVIDVSEVVRHYWYFVLAIIVATFFALKIWRKTRSGAYVVDRVKLKLPVFGVLVTKTAVARFSRTLGTLLSSGVPVLQALNIVRDTSGNEVVAQAIQHVHDSVKEGDSMSMPLEASGVFPTMVISMVDVGEETGALPDMLIKVADNYEEEVDMAVEALTSIIEPIMIILLALIIGTIVIAMFVPLVSIIQSLTTES